MKWFSRMRRRFAVLIRRDRFASELEEEMRAHIAMQAEENEADGMPAADALCAAKCQFGNATLMAETSGQVWGWAFLEQAMQDLRYALRMMRRSPGLTAAAIASLALGVGADTALFSIMDGMWFRPLAVRDPGAVVRVFSITEDQLRDDVAYADYSDMAKASRTFASLAASQRRGPILGVDGVVESAWTEVVSDNYFTVLGVNTALGRVFTERPEAEPALVISHRLWLRRFGGSPGAVGKRVTINDRPFVVAGVLPKEFRGIELWSDLELWLPMSAWSREEQLERERTGFTVLGRLRQGATLEQARTEVAALARNLALAYPKTNRGRGATVLSARQYQFAQGGALAVILAAIIGMLLLIACANVANLLLARAEGRRREIAVRLAIGCSRTRLIRQLLTESLLLAVLGAGAALLLARWLIGALPRVLPVDGPLFRLDYRVMAFALLATTLAALLFSLAPAWRGSRMPATRNDTAGGRARVVSLSDGLVIGQMALSMLLLVCAGLLVRSFVHCLRLDLGFARRNALIVRLDPDLPEAQARLAYQQLVERVRALPGVKQIGLVRRAPLWPSEGGVSIATTVPGHQPRDGRPSFNFHYTTAGDNYFRTMGIPFVRGRDFDARDNATGTPVAIINETMARRFWPGQDPVGRLIVTGKADRRQIVGVVKDTKVNAVLEAPAPYLYLPFGQDFPYTMSLVVEAAGDPLALARPIKGEVDALWKGPAPEVATLESLIRGSTVEQESMATTVSGLGAVGILLTAAGLYGVMSFLVARRTPEIGIRIAVGASRSNAVALVLRRALAMAGAGALLGLAGALALSRILASILFGVSPRDPATFSVAVALLLAVAVAASLSPAVRASRIDPIQALRHE